MAAENYIGEDILTRWEGNPAIVIEDVPSDKYRTIGLERSDVRSTAVER